MGFDRLPQAQSACKRPDFFLPERFPVFNIRFIFSTFAVRRDTILSSNPEDPL